MNTFQRLFFPLCSILIFCSCNTVSIHENQIDEDYWVVTKFEVNGVDSTAFVQYASILGYRFIISDNDDEKFDRFHQIFEVAADGSEKLFGHWGRREKNQMFLGVEYKEEDTGPFYAEHYHHFFEIEKLSNNEMEYSLTLDGNTYELTFER